LPGQDHDAPHDLELLCDKQSAFVIANKAYGSRRVIEFIQMRGAIPVIHFRSNAIQARVYDKQLHKE